MNGFADFRKALADILVGNAGKLRGTDSCKGRFVKENHHRSFQQRQPVCLPAGFHGHELNRGISELGIIKNGAFVLIENSDTECERAGNLTFNGDGGISEGLQTIPKREKSAGGVLFQGKPRGIKFDFPLNHRHIVFKKTQQIAMI